MERITSRQNPLVREFRTLRLSSRGQQTGDGQRVLLDGAHLLQDALACGVAVEVVAVGDDGAVEATEMAVRAAAAAGARVVQVPASVLAAISPVREPSGIVAIARRRPDTLHAALAAAPQLVLMLSVVQDPGNVGAIVRAAEACGATGIVTSEGTADPFGWKALRGSMGSAFRVPIAVRQALDGAARTAREQGLAVYAAVPREGTALPRCDLRRPAAILLGSEGAGLADGLAAVADQRLTIPMHGAAESLNVATAAALIAYEAQRQRAGALE